VSRSVLFLRASCREARLVGDVVCLIGWCAYLSRWGCCMSVAQWCSTVCTCLPRSAKNNNNNKKNLRRCKMLKI